MSVESSSYSRRSIFKAGGVIGAAGLMGGALASLPGPFDRPAEAAGVPGIDMNATWGSEMGLAIPAYDLMWEKQLDVKRPRLQETLNTAKGTQVKWLRTDLWINSMSWDGPNQVYWDEADRVINAAIASGFKLMICVQTMPKYARPKGTNERTGPTTAAHRKVYTDFMKKVVARYKSKVKHYEIWNEPNLTQFWGKPSIDGYGQLLKESYQAIKSVDSTAVVVSGGTGGANPTTADIDALEFLKGLYSKGYLKRYSDQVAIHAYTASAQGNLGEFWRLQTYRQIMDQNGDSTKRLAITEAGSHVFPGTKATEGNQAYLTKPAIESWAEVHHRGPLMWFSLYNPVNDSCGLIRDDYKTKRPAFDVLAVQAKRKGVPDPKRKY